jgi:hypothetical protein
MASILHIILHLYTYVSETIRERGLQEIFTILFSGGCNQIGLFSPPLILNYI